MKNKLAITLVMMACFTTQVYADDTGGNVVYIKQVTGEGLDLQINQTGYNNTVGDAAALQPYFEIEGDNITAAIVQNGMNNVIVGNLIGTGTTANITQTGAGNELTLNYGNAGTMDGNLDITNTGDTNILTLNFGTTNNTRGYNFDIAITGNDNTITTTTNAQYAIVDVTITGDQNTITTTQIGNNGTTNQPGHEIVITADGNGNTIAITQDGVTQRNVVNLDLTGNNGQVTINQH